MATKENDYQKLSRGQLINLVEEYTKKEEKFIQSQKAFLESEERFRELFNHMTSGVAVYEAVNDGEDFIIKNMNKMGCKISNVELKDVIGKKVTEMFSGIKDFGLFDVFQRVYKTGISVNLPITQYSDERMSFWVENNVYKLSSGELVAVFDDLTENKKAEEALKRSREQYELAVKGTNDGIWDWNIRTNIVYLSEQLKKMIGYENHEFENTFDTFESHLHPDDRERVLENIDEYLHGKIDQYAIEFRFRHKDGKYIWILDRGEALRDENGKPYRMTGSYSNITERKIAENEVKKTLETTQQILKSMPFGILIIDNKKIVRLANETALKIMGKSEEEVVNKNCFENICPSVNGNCPIWDKNKTIDNSEKEIIGKNGIRIPILKTAIPITLNNEDVILEAFVDITELKKIQKELEEARLGAEKANTAKSEFLANMSHEIRTPLNSVIGFSELLSSILTDTKQLNYVNAIKKSGKTLLMLINDILDFSKIEANKMKIQYEQINLKSILHEMENIFSIKIKDKQLYYTTIIDEDFPNSIYLDENRLRQVLLNIIGNAVKFTNSGGVKIEVKSRVLKDKIEVKDIESIALDLESGFIDVIIIITDTGIGINPDQINNIFDSFCQEDARMNRKFEGTGLGLTISKRLVELMNGKITVKTRPNKGSSFIVTFHRVAIGKNIGPIDEILEHPELNKILFDEKLVLVVDDVYSNRLLVTEILKKVGLKVIEAENGHQAILRAQEKKPDIILMDIFMAQMDGIEASKKIKSLPPLENIPIIALSASSLDRASNNLGDLDIFDGYISKPISVNSLIEILKKHFSYHEINDSIIIDDKVKIDDIDFSLIKKNNSKKVNNEIKFIIENIENLLKIFSIDNADELVKQMNSFADEYDIKILNNLIINLNGHVNSFNITESEKILNNLKDILSKIKEEIN